MNQYQKEEREITIFNKKKIIMQNIEYNKKKLKTKTKFRVKFIL